MNRICYTKNLLKTSLAAVLLLSLLVQSGYVSVEKVACGSCDDKVSISQVNSCCSIKALPAGNLCTIEQKCCKSEKSDYQFYRINQNLSNLKFSDFIIGDALVPTSGVQDIWLQRFSSWNIHGPPIIRNTGRNILIAICKLTL